MTKTKLFALSVVLVAFSGAAFAQTAPAGAPPAAAAEPASPPAAAPAPPPAAAPSDARAACTTAMNADPQFAAAIIKVADEKAAKQRDDDLLAAHQAADAHIKKNERQVIYAYAAMWIVAAAFVLFLWRRQQALKDEIVHLRRDLEAAAADPKAQPGRA